MRAEWGGEMLPDEDDYPIELEYGFVDFYDFYDLTDAVTLRPEREELMKRMKAKKRALDAARRKLDTQGRRDNGDGSQEG